MCSRITISILLFVLITLALLYGQVNVRESNGPAVFIVTDDNYTATDKRFAISVRPLYVDGKRHEIVIQLYFSPGPGFTDGSGLLTDSVTIENNSLGAPLIILKAREFALSRRMVIPVNGDNTMYPVDKYDCNFNFRAATSGQHIPLKVTVEDFDKFSYSRLHLPHHHSVGNGWHRVNFSVIPDDTLIVVSIVTALLIWTLNIYSLVAVYTLLMAGRSLTLFVIALASINLMAMYQIRSCLPNIPNIGTPCLYDYCVNIWTIVAVSICAMLLLYSWFGLRKRPGEKLKVPHIDEHDTTKGGIRLEPTKSSRRNSRPKP